jgi:hypothetical protein
VVVGGWCPPPADSTARRLKRGRWASIVGRRSASHLLVPLRASCYVLTAVSAQVEPGVVSWGVTTGHSSQGPGAHTGPHTSGREQRSGAKKRRGDRDAPAGCGAGCVGGAASHSSSWAFSLFEPCKRLCASTRLSVLPSLARVVGMHGTRQPVLGGARRVSSFTPSQQCTQLRPLSLAGAHLVMESQAVCGSLLGVGAATGAFHRSTGRRLYATWH